ncbi:MAG: elongation factor Ts [Phycisphaerae bacterium]|jgi:elongation factor Ts|nr:MAG: elongation factor Ts [Phycisphaerae bacterium]
MAAITASLVNELRNKTGLGMMECKKMLTETGGDIQKAIDEFRKKGVKASITERAATEGRVEVLTRGNTAVAVEVVCNTDFTAKSDEVLKVAQRAAEFLALNASASANDDPGIQEALANASKVTGENVQLGRTAVLNGNVGSYLYSTAGKGKIGVLLQFSASANEELIKALGMHIAAARPLALSRDQVPADLVAKEREIAIEQAKATGKPQNIAEKIAEGKMASFYSERVLLDQEFVNADFFKGKVSDLLKSKGVELVKYVRLEVGQA